MTIGIKSNRFMLLEEWPRDLIPRMGETCQDPDNLIKTLISKNKGTLFSFHYRDTLMKNKLKMNNSLFVPNKLLTRYLYQLSRTTNLKYCVKNDCKNLLRSLKQRGDNIQNI